MQRNVIHACHSFESVLASSFQVSTQIHLFLNKMFRACLGHEVTVEEETNISEEQADGPAEKAADDTFTGPSPPKLRKLSSEPDQEPCSQGGDAESEALAKTEAAPPAMEWPTRKTFAGRKRPDPPRDPLPWDIKRSAFYTNLPPSYWKDHYERKWWKMYDGEMSAVEAKQIFLAQVAEEDSA